MSACVKCGREAGPLSDAMRRAKERLGMPLTPPKVCPPCVWTTLLTLDDDLTAEPSSPHRTGESK